MHSAVKGLISPKAHIHMHPAVKGLISPKAYIYMHPAVKGLISPKAHIYMHPAVKGLIVNSGKHQDKILGSITSGRKFSHMTFSDINNPIYRHS